MGRIEDGKREKDVSDDRWDAWKMGRQRTVSMVTIGMDGGWEETKKQRERNRKVERCL